MHIIKLDKLKPFKKGDKSRRLLLFVLPYFVGKTDALGVKTRSYLAFPYGPLTIATYVGAKSETGSTVIIEDLNLLDEDINYGEYCLKRMSDLNPDFIGFSFMFDSSFSHLTELSSLLKNHFPNTLQIVGGAAATTAAAEILKSIPSIFAVCYSEGETAIKNLLDSHDFQEEFKKDPWVTRTLQSQFKPQAVYVDNLDDVIDLNYDYVNVTKYSMRESFSPFAAYRYEADVKQFFLVTSRGCPFKCTFCAEPALHGANMRFASVESIIEHVRTLKERYGLNVLTLYDDQLLIDVPRAKQLFKQLAQFNLRIEMPNGVTAVFIDNELAFAMKRAGVDSITLAIESGSEFVLRNIINKPLRIPKLKKVMRSLRAADIFVQGFFVIGMPGELDLHRLETLNLIKDIDLDWASFSVAAPVRGSQLYEDAIKNGWLPKEYSLGNFVSNSAVMNIPGHDNKKIMDTAIEFNLISNFMNNRALRLGDYETARRLFMEVSERADRHAFAYYFLYLVERKIGLESATVNQKISMEIFSSDPKWMSLAQKFKLFELDLDSLVNFKDDVSIT